MTFLLDKMIVRHILTGLAKLDDDKILTQAEQLSLAFYWQNRNRYSLYIVPASYNILTNMNLHSSDLKELVELFLNSVDVIQPQKYFVRWARRLRRYGFTREDAAVLALGTFGGDENAGILVTDILLTFDQPLLNNWDTHHEAIQDHLATMCQDLPEPYRQAKLPQLLRPEQLL